MWLLLIFLGLITYYLLKRSVAPITPIPIWIFWLVMMTPAAIWTTWYTVKPDVPIPTWLVVVPLMVCFTLYWWLLQKGRIPSEKQESKNQELNNTTPETSKPPEESEKLRPITASEEKSLRDCFPWAIYYLQNLDYRPQAILCRGKLRTAPEEAYKSIKRNIEQVFGDRFIILFQEGLPGNPFFALVPNPWAKSQEKTQDKSEKITRPFFALTLLLLTVFTTTLIGAEMAGVSTKALEDNLGLLLQGLPYSLGLIVILGVHEFSHYIAAVRYKIITTLPYFIPIPFFLGTFGAFIQMKSPVPNRKALFDVGIAGPLGGFLVTIPILLWGLSLSEIVPLSTDATNATLLSFQALDPRFSFLFAVFAKVALGSSFVAGKAIHLHPLAISGYVGLIVTALNLMPVGQLDGGHVVHAMFGQRTAIIVGQLTRLFMLILAMIRQEFLIWAILLFLMPITDQPALNDVTELNDQRDILGLFSLALLMVILLPLPGVVAHWLHI